MKGRLKHRQWRLPTIIIAEIGIQDKSLFTDRMLKVIHKYWLLRLTYISCVLSVKENWTYIFNGAIFHWLINKRNQLNKWITKITICNKKQSTKGSYGQMVEQIKVIMQKAITLPSTVKVTKHDMTSFQRIRLCVTVYKVLSPNH